MEVPRDRGGTFQTELFDRYQRSEKALVLALMQMVVQGVLARRVKKTTNRLCGRRFPEESTVSELAKGLGEQVKVWAERPLTECPLGECPLGECPFLICDGMQVKVRRQGAVRATTVLLAVGVTSEGQREILRWRWPSQRPARRGNVCSANSKSAASPAAWRLPPVMGTRASKGPPKKVSPASGSAA